MNLRKRSTVMIVAIFAVFINANSSFGQNVPFVTATKSGVKIDLSKYDVKKVTVKNKTMIVLYATGAPGDKKAVVAMTCGGCDGCGAEFEKYGSEKGTVTCKSLGCSPCSIIYISGEILDDKLKETL